MKSKALYIGTFAAAAVVSLLFWNFIQIPLSETHGVVSFLTELKFNPTNNLVRFAVFCLLPLAFLLVLHRFFPLQENNQSTNANADKGAKDRWLFITCFLLLAVLIPTFHASGSYDWFHEGEALSAAEAVRQGLAPYKDVWFIHGLYQDVGRILLSFFIFEPSIDAARSLESIHKLIAYLFLALVLLELFPKNSVKYWFAGAVIFALHGANFLPPIGVIPRDILPLIFLLILLRNKHIQNSSILLGLLPWLCLLYALDRGVYLFAVLILWMLLKKVMGEFNLKDLLRVGMGFIGGFGIFILTLKQDSLYFFPSVFRMLKHHDLLMGFPYPIFQLKFLIAAALLSSALYWLAAKFLFIIKQSETKETFKTFASLYYIEIFLLAFAALWFRNILNRPDKIHLEYGMLFTYLFWIYVFITHYSGKIIRKEVGTVSKAALILVAAVSTLNLAAGRGLYKNFPHLYPGRSDFLADYSAAFKLEKHIGDDEILVFSSDATWYHVLGKAPVVGHSQIWLAGTEAMQIELIQNLDQAKLKWVIRDKRSERFIVDGIELDKRLPLIAEYLEQNFSQIGSFDGVELLERS